MAIGPIDYSVNVQTPFQSALQGFGGGLAVKQAMDAETAKAQQQQAARAMAGDLATFSATPNRTAKDYAAIVAKYPQLSEHFKRAWDMESPDVKTARVSEMSNIFSAVHNGAPEVAIDLLTKKAEAARNSGDAQTADSAEAMIRLIKTNPEAAKTSVGLGLYASTGDEKFAETLAKIGGEQRAAALAPAQLTEAQAKAHSAAVAAQFAESNAALDLQKKGWDITKIQADIDIAKENARIAAMNAAIAREGNELKREELRMKLADAQRARDDKVREKEAEASSATGNIDNMLNTIERVLRAPGLHNVVGAVEGRIPALLSDESADAIALIDTLGSQAFLSQIPNIKGMGQLSNAEGDKLQSALQNLTRKQSETQFKANLNEATRLLRKARANIEHRLGVPESVPDTPANPAAAAPRAISGDADYAALAPGALYTAPDGTVRRKSQ